MTNVFRLTDDKVEYVYWLTRGFPVQESPAGKPLHVRYQVQSKSNKFSEDHGITHQPLVHTLAELTTFKFPSRLASRLAKIPKSVSSGGMSFPIAARP